MKKKLLITAVALGVLALTDEMVRQNRQLKELRRAHNAHIDKHVKAWEAQQRRIVDQEFDRIVDNFDRW